MTTIFYPLKKTTVSFTFVKAAILSAAVILTVCSSYAQTAPAPLPKGSSGKGAQDEIRSFQAQPANKKIVLNWTASADRTTSHYVIQRSTDGKSFDDKAVLFTAEENNNTNCSYNYADNISSVNAKIMYYRLKMVAMDGNYTYSDVATVNVKQAKQFNMASNYTAVAAVAMTK